jgi:hypothetical protein
MNNEPTPPTKLEWLEHTLEDMAGVIDELHQALGEALEIIDEFVPASERQKIDDLQYAINQLIKTYEKYTTPTLPPADQQEDAE